MSKKILAMILAIVMVLGTVPVLALFSSADSFGLYGSGYEGVSYNPATLQLTDIILLFTYGCDAQTDMSQNPGNYTWVLHIDGVDYTAQPSSFYSDWLVRFKPLQWSTAYVPAWGSTVVFGLTVYSGGTAVLDTGTTVQITFPDEPERAGSVPATLIDGTSVTWAFDASTATLTFDGTGSVPSYSDTTTRPWHSLSGDIMKVVVKGGITAVGDRACNTLANLDEIVLEQGVTSTGFDCFAHCGTITNVYLPTTLTSMSQGGFYGSSVTNVYYDDTSRDFGNRCTMGAYNEAITNAHWVNDPDWGSAGYIDDGETILWSFDQSTGTLTISGNGAIPTVATKPWQSYVSQITSVVIGNGITSIPGGGLFARLDNLNRVEMADTVTSIGGDAFAYNGMVSYMRLSSNVTSIGQGVLYSTTVQTISCTKDWRAIQQQSSVGDYNASFGTATWIDCTVFGTYFSFGKYGTGMENWQGNGDPNLTQILIATPKWDGNYISDLNDDEWILTIEPVDGSEDAVTTALYPRSVYDGGTWAILRFVPALSSDPAGRFSPTPGKAYKITATITYNGVTETVTSGDTFYLDANATPITFANYYDITWQIEGVTEYVEEVPEGFKPVYHGEAEDYYEGYMAYVVNVPATVAANADATYNVTYTAVDRRDCTLALWGDGYENWPNGTGGNQTQLLLRPKDWQGNDLSYVAQNWNTFTWTITIDGVDYTGLVPSSNYGAQIFRFEPCLWTTPFIPRAGTSYEFGVKIYDANNVLLYKTTTPTTITFAADFVPTHDHFTNCTFDFTTRATFTSGGECVCTCGDCGYVWTEEFEAATVGVYDSVIVDEKDGKNTATVIGTIFGFGFDTTCADKMSYTLTFKQGDDIVKEVSGTTSSIFTTLKDVASVDEATAENQGITYVDYATYMFAVRMVGIPAGNYNVEVTVGAVLGETTVATAEADIAFTV